MSNQPILFFDGDCELCNKSVDYILCHDTQKQIKTMPLQDNEAQRILKSHSISNIDFATAYLLHNNRVYSKSDVFLKTMEILDTKWAYLRFLKWVPKFARDAIYDIVAKHRK